MRRWLHLVPVIAALWPALAPAQQIFGEPMIGSSAIESQNRQDVQGQLSSDQTVETFQILVVGDALGGGLGAGMMRLLKDEAGYEVTLRFNELSGIARPELYDWSETLPKLVEGKTFDAIVMLIGENDRQEMLSGDVRYVFGGSEWTAAYRAQLDKVTAALKATGSAVYWVSLPPMGDAGYDAAMRQVTALQKDRATAAGLHFLDIRKAFLDASGIYTDRGPDDTDTVRILRGRDGVSFYKAGNNRLAQLVLAAIRSDAEASQAPAPPQPPPAPASAALTSLPANLIPPAAPSAPLDPLFGQIGGDGVAITFRGKDIALASAANTSPIAAVQALAPPGSAAEDLLVKGVSAAAPAGRADDYTLPAK